MYILSTCCTKRYMITVLCFVYITIFCIASPECTLICAESKDDEILQEDDERKSFVSSITSIIINVVFFIVFVILYMILYKSSQSQTSRGKTTTRNQSGGYSVNKDDLERRKKAEEILMNLKNEKEEVTKELEEFGDELDKLQTGDKILDESQFKELQKQLKEQYFSKKLEELKKKTSVLQDEMNLNSLCISSAR